MAIAQAACEAASHAAYAKRYPLGKAFVAIKIRVESRSLCKINGFRDNATIGSNN